MSNLLLDWINNDLQLSQHVESLDTEMRNGYLIGEVLYRHNQLHCFDRFLRKNNADAQINNFCLAEPVLRAMGIRFDAQVAFALMTGQRGAASNILYKIKMVLDRLKSIALRAGTMSAPDPSVIPLPNMPMRLSKPEYDKASQMMFESALRQLVDNPTEALIRDHLRPFYEAGERFERDVEAGKLKSLQDTMELDSSMRQKRLYDQQQNRAFMQAFDQRGLEVWMENQEKARARQTVKQNVLNKQAAVRSARSKVSRDANQQQVVDGIFDFEARIGLMNTMNGTDLAHDSTHSNELSPRQEMKKQVQEMRQHKSEAERLSLERERRRRRFITEREEAQVAEYHLRAASHLQEQLSRTCISEKSMLTTLSLVSQHRITMADNRSFRATQYKLRAAVDLEESLKRDNAFLDQARHVYASELDAQVTRYGKVLEARSCAQRTRNVETCLEILHRAVDLALEVVAYRRFAQPSGPSPDQTGTDALIPTLPWADMRRVFVGNRKGLLSLDGDGKLLEISEGHIEEETNAWGKSTALKSSQVWPSAQQKRREASLAPPPPPPLAIAAEKESSEEVKKPLNEANSESLLISMDLDNADLTHYLNNEFPFNDDTVENLVQASRQLPFEEIELPSALASVVDKVPPYFALGEVILETRLAAFPIPPPPPPPLLPQFDIRVCFCGRSFSGKSEQAHLIAERFKLSVINAETTLGEAIGLGLELSQGKLKASELPPLTAELLSIGYKAMGLLHEGGALSDDLYAQLVLVAIKRVDEENAKLVEAGELPHQGWVCDDFPETASQARCLEKLLSGYDETAHISSKWDKSSVLAEPTAASPLDPNRLQGKSGVDIVIYMDADRDVVLRRSLGRRVDPEHDKAYHLDTNRPPYDLVCKERLVSPVDPSCPSEQLALQVAAHDLQVDELKAFYNPFGNLRVVDCNTLSTQGSFAATIGVIQQFIETRTEEEEAKAKACAQENSTGDDLDEEAGTAVGEDIEAGEGVPDLSKEEVAEKKQQESTATMVVQELGPCPSELASMLVKLWDCVELDITTSMKQVFRALREERRSVVTHVHDMRVNFADFLKRPDLNNNIASAFFSAFNAIPMLMRCSDGTKNELRLRCNELRLQLWSKIEAREVANNARLAAARADGWLGLRVLHVERSFCTLMQIELDRFMAAMHLLIDFTTAHRGIDLEDLDVVKAAVPGKDKQAAAVVPMPMRATIVTDVTGPALTKRAKPPGKIDPLKAPAKDKKATGKAEMIVPEPDKNDVLVQVCRAAVAEITPWTKDQFPIPAQEEGGVKPLPGMYQAIWVQADLAIARIERLVAKGSCVRNELEHEVAHVWFEMDQWIGERIEDELTAAEKLVSVCSEAVEEERPIREDWVIDGAVVEVNPNYRLVQPPPSSPDPKVVPIFHQKLNQVQIVGLRKALATASAAEGFADRNEPLLSTDALQALLLRLSGNDTDLPEFWSLEPASTNFEQVIDILDPGNTGFVSTADVLNFFIAQK